MGLSRRKFLGHAGCAAMANTTVLSSLLNLKALGAAAMSDSDVLAGDDYKALVCISLSGGNDAYNMLLPTSQREFQDYARVRGNVGISLQNIGHLNPLNTPGRTFGVNGSMPLIRNLFNEGKAAFFANIGTLIEPMTVDDFWIESKRIPLGLLSHSDQLQQWMTAVPHERAAVGWGGRIADMINQMNNSEGLSMNVSFGGSNVFQTGVENIAYAMEPNPLNETPLKEIRDYNDDWLYNSIRKKAVDSLLERTYSDIYENTYINTARSARDGWLRYRDALNSINLNTSFDYADMYSDNSQLANSLGWVAKMIGAREDLGFRRQTFFIDFGGWDHHDGLEDQPRMLAELDFSVNQFQEAMKELGTEDCVVTFLVSDFARTLRSNGNGTDHAWGSNMMAIGGPVKGQRIYGHYPETLDPGQNPSDLGGGIILPSTSADVYFAELAHWFGVSKSNLEEIFPNLINFYDYRTAEGNPLDFLTIS